MAGFPATPTRDSFGPKLVDRIPVRDDTRQLGADAMNLAFWQLAGAGRTLPKAVFIYDPEADGGAGAVVWQQLAWDPKRELAPLASVKTGTGVYKVTFAASYADERGELVAFVPRAAMPGPVNYPAAEVRYTLVGLDLNLTVFDEDFVAQDAAVFVAVFG